MRWRKGWHLLAGVVLVCGLMGAAREPALFTIKGPSTETSTAVGPNKTVAGWNSFAVTWDITAADRTDLDETYDLYLVCDDGLTSWDMMHFPQIVTTGAKTFHATMNGWLIPQEVTTAEPGVATTSSATLRTDTTAAARTLTAGVIRHAPCGHNLRWELVLGGTTPSITSSIVGVGRP